MFISLTSPEGHFFLVNSKYVRSVHANPQGGSYVHTKRLSHPAQESISEIARRLQCARPLPSD